MNRRGMNFFEFLTAVFIILKLTPERIASWSWLMIFIPVIIYMIYASVRWAWEAMDIKHNIQRELRNMPDTVARKAVLRKAVRQERENIRKKYGNDKN